MTYEKVKTKFFSFIPKYKYEMEQIVHKNFLPDERVQFAKALIEKHSLIIAEPDGEDTAGRQKMRRATAQEIVAHACDISEAAFAEFAERGWQVESPAYEEWVRMGQENSKNSNEI